MASTATVTPAPVAAKAPPINKGPLLKPDQIVALVITFITLGALFVFVLALLGVFDEDKPEIVLTPVPDVESE